MRLASVLNFCKPESIADRHHFKAANHRRNGLSPRPQPTGSHFFSGPYPWDPNWRGKTRVKTRASRESKPTGCRLQVAYQTIAMPAAKKRARRVRPRVNFQPKRADVKCHSCQRPLGQAGRPAHPSLPRGHDSGRDGGGRECSASHATRETRAKGRATQCHWIRGMSSTGSWHAKAGSKISMPNPASVKKFRRRAQQPTDPNFLGLTCHLFHRQRWK
jgi:hypothetical protein